jgi:dephospho-CoA kinase
LRLIGITGGIGSGKTTVTDALRALSAAVIDADEISREISAPGAPAYREVVSRWGDSVLKEDGTWDRGAIASIVFNDEAERRWIESVTHPRILEEIRRRIREYSGEPVVFISAALLYESGNILPMLDSVWLCHAPEDVIIRRVTARDGVDEETVRKRMNAQLSFEEKKDRASTVINTDKPFSDLHEEIENLLRKERRAADSY